LRTFSFGAPVFAGGYNIEHGKKYFPFLPQNKEVFVCCTNNVPPPLPLWDSTKITFTVFRNSKDSFSVPVILKVLVLISYKKFLLIGHWL
jgi:hypothetical protein